MQQKHSDISHINEEGVTVISFLGELIRRRKYLPNQIAADLGVSHPAVAWWLSGNSIPSYWLLP
jgi:transcriptional regulator with XRE-family HTH domain